MTPVVHVDPFHGTSGLLLYWHGTQSNKGSFETGCIHGMSTNLSFFVGDTRFLLDVFTKNTLRFYLAVRQGKSTILDGVCRSNNGGFSMVNMVMQVYRRVGGLEIRKTCLSQHYLS